MMKKAERQSSRATLQEVAALASVSASTVSLVLAGKAGTRRISEDTHLRVRKAAEELNYAPNLLTRSLRRGRTHIISFFSSFRNRDQDDQYIDKLVAAIESNGGQAGYDVLVHCNFNRSPKEIYQFLNGGLADGLLFFAPSSNDPLLPLLRKSALPVAIICGRDPERMYPSVADDREQGINLIAENLLANGHRRIAAFISEGPTVRESRSRVELLSDKLAFSGITIPPEYMPISGSDILANVRELMSQQEPPTALFCWHDRLAYRVLAACEELGISVPGDLSVVGYDGLPWPSATSHVASSVAVDLHSLANRAVRILDQYIDGYNGPLLEEVQPVTFLSGTSLGAAKPLQWSNKK